MLKLKDVTVGSEKVDIVYCFNGRQIFKCVNITEIKNKIDASLNLLNEDVIVLSLKDYKNIINYISELTQMYNEVKNERDQLLKYGYLED